MENVNNQQCKTSWHFISTCLLLYVDLTDNWFSYHQPCLNIRSLFSQIWNIQNQKVTQLSVWEGERGCKYEMINYDGINATKCHWSQIQTEALCISANLHSASIKATTTEIDKHRKKLRILTSRVWHVTRSLQSMFNNGMILIVRASRH